MDSTNFAFQGKFYIIKGQISELIALRLKSLDRLIWMSYVTYRWGMIFSLGKIIGHLISSLCNYANE